MKKIQLLILALPALLGFTACENDTQGIGNSLIQEESQIIIHDNFPMTGSTVLNERIESRTVTQLLGDIDAKGYGRFASDFVCQFMPASSLDTDGVTAADLDSIKLILAYANGSFVGDSVAPMGLEVYRLNRQLPSPIFSTFDPAQYADLQSAPLAQQIYVGNAQGQSDSIAGLPYREIKVDLPLSLGRELFDLYVNNPGAYEFPSTFARHFPGLYVRNNFGAGRVTQITRTTMELYYHTTSVDAEGKSVKTPHTGSYWAVTPEVVSNNNISFTIDPALQARIDAGESIIVAPVGRDVQITFPIMDVIDYYLANKGELAVINSLSLSIPIEKIANDYGIEPPTELLMVRSDSNEEFFLDNSLTDDKTSFLATYAPGDQAYNVTVMRTYFLEMLEKYNRDGYLDAADYTFTLTPVTLTTETTNNGYTSSTYVSAITPYIGAPAMVRLLVDKADISFQFSRRVLK